MICDGLGRPLTFFLSPGQMSDAKGALALLRDLPPARTLLADKGYDADWFRQALEDRGIAACIPARRGRRECQELCVSERAHAVFRYVQASKRPANIMAS